MSRCTRYRGLDLKAGSCHRVVVKLTSGFFDTMRHVQGDIKKKNSYFFVMWCDALQMKADESDAKEKANMFC